VCNWKDQLKRKYLLLIKELIKKHIEQRNFRLIPIRPIIFMLHKVVPHMVQEIKIFY